MPAISGRRGLQTVDPERSDVLDPTSHPTLNLVTCYPFDFIGPAPLRFIVRAREVVPPLGRDAEHRREHERDEDREDLEAGAVEALGFDEVADGAAGLCEQVVVDPLLVERELRERVVAVDEDRVGRRFPERGRAAGRDLDLKRENPRALVGAVGKVQGVGLGHEDLLLVTLGARLFEERASRRQIGPFQRFRGKFAAQQHFIADHDRADRLRP